MMKAARSACHFASLALLISGLAACNSTVGQPIPEDQVLAPGVDLRAQAEGTGAAAIEVGHRLIASGEYELAIKSFNRAALERGTLDAETLSGLGTAHLQMGRLGEAEKLLKRAVDAEGAQPVDYNNYGVVLMEQDRTTEAIFYFRQAFALSNGENIAVRDNLRQALAKSQNSANTGTEEGSDFKLVQRGHSDFVIRSAQ
ncbi:MAG: tetratricopeptide repeat protein [Roseobacter sp.]